MTESTDKPNMPAKPDWALSGRERRAAERAAQGLPPKKRRLWLWLVLLVAVAGGGWYAYQSQSGSGPATAAVPLAEVETPVEEPDELVMQLLTSELVEVAPGPLRETVRLTGTLTPARQLGLPSEVAGHVQEVNVEAGDAVSQGDVLVQIDVQTLRNQLNQSRATAEATRAQLDLARNQLERTRNLVDRGISTSSELETQQSNVQQLEASLAALEPQVITAEQSLSDATVTAPFDGIVAARSVDPGAYVGLGTALLTLVDISSLTLEGTVPVLYAPQIETGLPVEVRVEGLSDRLFTGEVERVAPVAAEGTRMLPVYASLANDAGLLKGGMFASGVLVLEETAGAIGIPATALREDAEGATYVLKREGNRVVRQDVEVARSWDRGRVAEIAAGLSAGDVIVSEPMEQLRAGTRVTVVGE